MGTTCSPVHHYLVPLADHVVGRNLLPLFRGHDRADFEIVCYSEVLRPDSTTEEFRRYADQWRHTVGMPDDTVAEMIRQDGIDILVDLTQHMAGNRLRMFARRPAPVGSVVPPRKWQCPPGVVIGGPAAFIALQNIAQAGDNIVSSTDLYGGTWNLFANTFKDMGIETRFDYSCLGDTVNVASRVEGDRRLEKAAAFAGDVGVGECQAGWLT